MRIDRCKGCGEYIDIASDHAADCPTRKTMSRSVRGPCYTRHEVAPGAHADIPHEHDEDAPTPACDAELRNKRALYLLETEWGCGRINIAQMQRLLRGDGEDTECAH